MNLMPLPPPASLRSPVRDLRRHLPWMVGLILGAGLLPSLAAPSAGTPEARAEAFFASLQAGQIDEAFSQLFEGSPTTRARTLYPAERRSDLTSFLQSYGEVIGVELLHQTHHGHSLVRLLYLLKLRDYPVMCELIFYRPADAWNLTWLEFNDQFQDLP